MDLGRKGDMPFFPLWIRQLGAGGGLDLLHGTKKNSGMDDTEDMNTTLRSVFCLFLLKSSVA
jgi:hypothetical protein